MNKWRVVFSSTAEKDFIKLNRPTRQRVIDSLLWFSENFDSIVPLPLGGPWKGFFKLRVGDWRVIYEIQFSTQTIHVSYIDHRSKIYKRS